MIVCVRDQRVHPELFRGDLGRPSGQLEDFLADQIRNAPEAPRARVRDALAVGLARTTRRLSRLSRLGAGSSLPGVVAEALSPGFTARRAAAVPEGVVVVSGTNGKTTTAAMIGAIFSRAGIPTFGNDTGANLRGGIAAALVEAPSGARKAVLEVDEGALPSMVSNLRPRLLVLTNVFRDQLDRFGETERVVALIRDACDLLPAGAMIIANGDDPLLRAALTGRHYISFGVRSEPEDPARRDPASAEPEVCPRCGGGLSYEVRMVGHLGRYRCPACAWGWMPADVEIQVVQRNGLSSIELQTEGDAFTLPVGGVYNAYNAAAALAAGRFSGIGPRTGVAALRAFKPRFGRLEQLSVDGRKVWLALMKNPGSADALIQEIAGDPMLGAVVIALNHAAADGRDVSWIWDVNLEELTAAGVRCIPSGTRAADVAVRLKYTGARVERAHRRPLDAIRAAIALSDDGHPPVVLATYTAMLEVRTALSGRVARLTDIPA